MTKHEIGDIVTYLPYYNPHSPRHGIIVYWVCHVYKKYRVAWFDGGTSEFTDEEITVLKKNFKKVSK